MSYRGPNSQRISVQASENIFPNAGQTAIWKSLTSNSANFPAGGLDSTPTYREQLITALFGKVEQAEHQTPGGLLAGAEIFCVTRERLNRQDEIRWQGVNYRVDSDPAPAKIAGTFTCILKRVGI